MRRNRAVYAPRRLCGRVHKYKRGMPMTLVCGVIACCRFGWVGGGGKGSVSRGESPSLLVSAGINHPPPRDEIPSIHASAHARVAILSYQLSLSLLLLLRTTTSLVQNHFNLDLGVDPPSLQASNLSLWSLGFLRKMLFIDSIRVAKKNRWARKSLCVTLFAFLQSDYVRDGQEKCYPTYFLCFITHTTHYSHKPIIKPR